MATKRRNKLVALHAKPRGTFAKGELYGECAPFYVNHRGVLAHRVRALVNRRGFYRSIDYVHCWCGDVKSTDSDEELDFDPGDRLVCARCEAAATEAGEETSQELAGRHVCVGTVRPVNLCCSTDDN